MAKSTVADAAAQHQDSQDTYHRVRAIVLSAVAGVLLLSVAIGVWFARSITGPLGQCVQVLRRTAPGPSADSHTPAPTMQEAPADAGLPTRLPAFHNHGSGTLFVAATKQRQTLLHELGARIIVAKDAPAASKRLFEQGNSTAHVASRSVCKGEIIQ
ncbi:hypothetical protein ACWT_5709 [Actinoplanes sp. SE50]|nr:hypothetical protein ACPL_5839 [Actinoplanes sp. SE50/110]ATO85124.1 hypothetical protein ACWT_5709 [Actinoplanes sp. SE50]SLM02535.1 hypothetical protein ACSP50_5785 [Actinoplanes sp. SE50/110]